MATQRTTAKPKLVENVTRYARFMQATQRVMRAHDNMMERAALNMEAVADAMESTTTYIAADGPDAPAEEIVAN